METRNRFIAPERMGAWLAVAFGLAVLALVVALVGIRQARVAAVVSQVEVMKLNDRVKALEMSKTKPPMAMPAPAAAPAK